MIKKYLLVSLLSITISAQAATTHQCPPANAISYSMAKLQWILDSAYASKWTVDFNLPGKNNEQVSPYAVLKEHAGNQMLCEYSYTIYSRGTFIITLWPKGTYRFDPRSNPYFHKIADGTPYGDYLCITSAASPEVCSVTA